MSKGICKLIK